METQSGPGSLGEDTSEPKHAVWGHLTQGVPTLLLPLFHHYMCPCSLWAGLPPALPSLLIPTTLLPAVTFPWDLHSCFISHIPSKLFCRRKAKERLIKLSPVLTWYRFKPVCVTAQECSHLGSCLHSSAYPGTARD